MQGHHTQKDKSHQSDILLDNSNNNNRCMEPDCPHHKVGDLSIDPHMAGDYSFDLHHMAGDWRTDLHHMAEDLESDLQHMAEDLVLFGELDFGLQHMAGDLMLFGELDFGLQHTADFLDFDLHYMAVDLRTDPQHRAEAKQLVQVLGTDQLHSSHKLRNLLLLRNLHKQFRNCIFGQLILTEKLLRLHQVAHLDQQLELG